MIGDQNDMRARIRSALPTRWFADGSPVLDGVLSGLSWAWARGYDMLGYVRAQTRLATASDLWLDMASADYFGVRVRRRANEADAVFRARIQRELNRQRGTRAAIASAVLDLTGQAPAVFEPARIADTGAWGGAGGVPLGFAYGAAGAWGSLSLPFQVFVTAYRPAGTGIPAVGGWGTQGGGYGAGALEYGTLAAIGGGVTDADIYAAIADVMPAATIAWTNITNQGR